MAVCNVVSNVVDVKYYISLCVLLRSESPSNKCAKLHTMPASNKRDQLTRSLYYCLFVPHIWVLFFTHILFVVNHIFSTMPTESLQQYLHHSWHLSMQSAEKRVFSNAVEQ